MATDLMAGMAGLSGAYSKVEEEDKAIRGVGKPFSPDEYERFICSFNRIATNSKGNYDGEHPWLPVTKDDLNIRLILGEEVMHWVVGEDSLGNEAWFNGEEKVLLFVRGRLFEVFQPENNYAHCLLCLEQCGHNYGIKKENKEYFVSIADKWHGKHSFREKAIVNALLSMVGKEFCCYEEDSAKKDSVPETSNEPQEGAVCLSGSGLSLKSIALPFCRR